MENRGRRNKNDFEDGVQLDKTQVLQEAKLSFTATSSRTKKLVDVLTKCIFMLLQGERLTNTEATDLFMHITRLFQHKDTTLRRLTYIGIKALSKQADNVYVVTSSLTTDVNSSKDDPAVRASALRALCQISDATNLTFIERYLRQSVVDKHPVVASAALTSLIRIAQVNGEIVRRCTNEIQEALKSDSPMVQYHALALRYMSCKHDRLATSRLLITCIEHGLKSPLAICLLLRILATYINDSPDSGDEKKYISYIRDCLNHRLEMVEYEAANTLVSIAKDPSQVKKYKVSSAVSRLRNFLSGSKPALRFAAVRALNRLAIVAPSEVAGCNLELEQLISQSDCNRSIAILAITTLLKTGTESSVDRFLKQIGEFLSEIDDEFKVIVVGTVRQLCQKYPSKHQAMMDFLSSMLHEDGGYAYKKAIVDTIIKIIEDNDETKEKGLEQLCEFIEDCEHNNLSVEVLNLLGREGPKTKKAPRYVRYIANRLLLDRSPVACAATTALAKFGTLPELKDSIKVALDRFSSHEDYDVRERVLFYKNILIANDPTFNQKFISNSKPQLSFSDFELKLMNYLDGDCNVPFNMANVARVDSSAVQNISLHPMDMVNRVDDDDMDDTPEVRARTDKNPSSLDARDSICRPPLDVFENINLGPLIKSTKSENLTEEVSEFGVKCIKHIYQRHIIFHFDCKNTVETMCLENVQIEMDAPPGFQVIESTEYPRMSFGETVPIYVCVKLVDQSCCEMNFFTNFQLKYDYRNVNPETRELSDEVDEDVFPLEDMLIDLSKELSPEHLEELQFLDEQED